MHYHNVCILYISSSDLFSDYQWLDLTEESLKQDIRQQLGNTSGPRQIKNKTSPTINITTVLLLTARYSFHIR